jgi:hypothetical protein
MVMRKNVFNPLTCLYRSSSLSSGIKANRIAPAGLEIVPILCPSVLKSFDSFPIGSKNVENFVS